MSNGEGSQATPLSRVQAAECYLRMVSKEFRESGSAKVADGVDQAIEHLLAAVSETSSSIEVAGVPVETLTVPLEHARLIRQACLPHNPNKCRNWDPDLLAAVRWFIAAVEGRRG